MGHPLKSLENTRIKNFSKIFGKTLYFCGKIRYDIIVGQRYDPRIEASSLTNNGGLKMNTAKIDVYVMTTKRGNRTYWNLVSDTDECANLYPANWLLNQAKSAYANAHGISIENINWIDLD